MIPCPIGAAGSRVLHQRDIEADEPLVARGDIAAQAEVGARLALDHISGSEGSESDAEAKFNKWLGEKEGKVTAKVNKLAAEANADKKARLTAEAAVKEARAAAIAERKAAAEAAAEAAAAAAEATEEAPAEEATETPAEE